MSSLLCKLAAVLIVLPLLSGGAAARESLAWAEDAFAKRAAPPAPRVKAMRLALVFGKDDRQRLPDSLGGLRDQIGLFRPAMPNGKKKACTAFCVASDVIATAAHCVMAVEGRKDRTLLKKSYFRLRLNEGPYSGARSNVFGILGHDEKDARERVIAGRTRNFRKAMGHFGRDWVLLRLHASACERPLPLKAVSEAALRKAGREGRLFLAGFHEDRKKEGLLHSPRCRIRGGSFVKDLKRKNPTGSRASIILHDCDTKGASSGSPLLMKTPEGPVVVGINVGHASYSRWRKRGGKVIWRKRLFSVNVAVPVAAFMDKTAILGEGKIVVGKTNIRRLQELLNANGFRAGRPDGVLGPRTRQALRAFRKSRGMAESDLPTWRLLFLLESASRVRTAAAGKGRVFGALEAKKRIWPTWRVKISRLKRRAKPLSGELGRELGDRIGLLRTGGGGGRRECTAFCVGGDIVATAAACMKGGKEAVFRLMTGKGSGKQGGKSWIGADLLRPERGEGHGGSWALLRLRRVACRRPLPLLAASVGFLRQAYDRAIHIVGARKDGLFQLTGCRVVGWSGAGEREDDGTPGIIRYECNSPDKFGGAPLLLKMSLGWHVVGIETGEKNDEKAILARGFKDTVRSARSAGGVPGGRSLRLDADGFTRSR